MTEVQRQKDPEFYFSFRTFQVEDTLFRVPRHLFPISNVQVQPSPDGADDGDDLVVLGDDIKKDDFLQLLRVVYPRHYNAAEAFNGDQWQTVFRLSKAFGMEAVRAKAASHLKDSFFAGDPVDALLCAKQNSLDDWVTPLIDKIVQGSRDLTRDELNEIGIELAMKIARAQGVAQAVAEREAREVAEREAREVAEREAQEVAMREAREVSEREAEEAMLSVYSRKSLSKKKNVKKGSTSQTTWGAMY